MNFEEVNEETWVSWIENKERISFEVSDQITHLSTELKGVGFTVDVEIAAAPINRTGEGISSVILQTSTDIAGKYTRFCVFVNFYGGKISYLNKGDGLYKATITWKK